MFVPVSSELTKLQKAFSHFYRFLIIKITYIIKLIYTNTLLINIIIVTYSRIQLPCLLINILLEEGDIIT